jgi:glycosyltransferase involved in cell wall biosynthesis
MTPRRVLMTTDTVGGVWTYALELARGLSAAGTEVMLAVIGPGPSEAQRAEAIAIPGLVLVLARLELEWQDRAGVLARVAAERLRGLAEAFEPDIVHCNGFREAAAGFTGPVVLVAHSCVRTWWRSCRGEELPLGWSAYAEGVRAGLAAATTLVAPTEAFLADLAAAWGQLPGPRVIRNGLDLDAPPTAKQPIILASGRLWDEAKNVAALATVAPDLPWPVRLAGDMPPHDAETWQVEWTGQLQREKLLQAMSEAAIYTAPARYEPFGLAILEAAAAGCALVLGNLPSLVELWGDAARFVPPGDMPALRRTLLDLIDDPEALARLQAAAGHRARDFSRGRMVEAYLGLYGQLMARASKGDRAA